MRRMWIIAAALAASTLLGGWSFDRQGRYCLFDPDFTNCGFPTFQACLETSRGVGGFCRRNPKYRGPEQTRPPRRGW